MRKRNRKRKRRRKRKRSEGGGGRGVRHDLGIKRECKTGRIIEKQLRGNKNWEGQ